MGRFGDLPGDGIVVSPPPIVETLSRSVLYTRRVVKCRENIAALRQQCEDLEADEAELNAKIKKKKSDLERGEKRLKSLQVR